MIELQSLQRLNVATLFQVFRKTASSRATLESSDKIAITIGSLYVDGKPCIDYTYQVGCLHLRYSVNGKPYSYDIGVVEHKSNLGIEGSYFYFVCPSTSRLCRNLYLYNGVFVSRFAIPGAIYESQEYQSSLSRAMSALFDSEKEIKRYGKEYYRGKITPYGKRLEKAYNRLKKARLQGWQI